MKNKVMCLLLCFILLPVCVAQALNEPDLPRVVDKAGSLTESEAAILRDTIQELIETYQMDVVILTLDSLGHKSAQDYADDYYDENGYGFGNNHSGILLLISIKDRDWWISTCGDAIYAVTDYGIQSLFSEMSAYLSMDMFYEAFDAYLNALPEYFEAYTNGGPIDGHIGSYDGPGSYFPGSTDDVIYYEDREGSFLLNFFISLLIGLVVALIAVLIMRGQMNTRRAQHSAAAYFRQGSYDLRVHRDLFLYSNISKTPRPKDNGGSRGGGSSIHRSSSGRSHGGGGGKF